MLPVYNKNMYQVRLFFVFDLIILFDAFDELAAFRIDQVHMFFAFDLIILFDTLDKLAAFCIKCLGCCVFYLLLVGVVGLCHYVNLFVFPYLATWKAQNNTSAF